MIVNAGHPEGSDALERVLAAGVGGALPHVARHPITSFNTLLVGGDDAAERRAAADTAAAGCLPSCDRCSPTRPPSLEPRARTTRARTRTTARRSSGSSTARSSQFAAGEG